MKILGVDVGKKRTGLAISDEKGKFAFPLEVIEEESEEKLVKRIIEISRREEVKTIVVGIPYSLRGKITPSTELALRVADKLREAGFRVEEIDERLTTREAGKIIKSKKKRGKIDKISASLLLQTWLERQIRI
ncbi:Holliday junction resolvase RuvX [bacterium]|nr:Holliday junction resolvase RuvX [bacterium]